MKRRNFLRNTAAAGAVLPLSIADLKFRAYGPNSVLASLARAAAQTDRVLVLIQLNGGNDGLNTLIPLDQYSNLSKARQNVLIPDNKVLGLNGKPATGLHPAMTGLQGLYNDGLVSAVQNVGYPSPNFSHFRSMDIWMSASDSNESHDRHARSAGHPNRFRRFAGLHGREHEPRDGHYRSVELL